MNKKEIYEKNRQKAKTLTILTPFVFWGLLIFGAFFFILAVKNSVGNMDEITSLLDSKKYTGEELHANYTYLTAKYGEWVIGSGSTGFTLTFIDVKNAVFSGVAVFSIIMSAVCFIGAFVLGKWLFPFLAKKLTQDNQDMVNLTILAGEE